jgi:3-deoxy-manno-octulosonate cytidylyltransferase (CMP-KDO synthetase)
MNPEVIAIIPARYSSSRLPGKPLLEIAGRPMILHVVERALSAKLVDRVIVATDDDRVLRVVSGAGYEAQMTSSEHRTGTDRLAEVARRLTAEIIVNIQGDEPFLSAETINAAIAPLLADEGLMMSTVSEPLASADEVLDPNVVKVVVDDRGFACYFSRAPIPFPRNEVSRHGSLDAALRADPTLLTRFRRHTGLYVYRRDFLSDFASWPTGRLESTELLEQLRALAAGIRIQVIPSDERSFGIDTQADLTRARLLTGSKT